MSYTRIPSSAPRRGVRCLLGFHRHRDEFDLPVPYAWIGFGHREYVCTRCGDTVILTGSGRFGPLC